jgi:hypothetical protein
MERRHGPTFAMSLEVCEGRKLFNFPVDLSELRGTCIQARFSLIPDTDAGGVCSGRRGGKWKMGVPGRWTRTRDGEKRFGFGGLKLR